MVYSVEGNGMPTWFGLWALLLYPGVAGVAARASGGFADRQSSTIRCVGLTSSSFRPRPRLFEFDWGVLLRLSLS
jgi:hypothetical protein